MTVKSESPWENIPNAGHEATTLVSNTLQKLGSKFVQGNCSLLPKANKLFLSYSYTSEFNFLVRKPWRSSFPNQAVV